MRHRLFTDGLSSYVVCWLQLIVHVNDLDRAQIIISFIRVVVEDYKVCAVLSSPFNQKVLTIDWNLVKELL
jgi:hypothetical protein